MTLIKWRASFETGVAEMDEQHKKIIELINEIYPSIRKENCREKLQKILGEMDQYALEHFEAEEGLLAQQNYPELDEHRESHKEYMVSLQQLKVQLEGEGGNDKDVATAIYSYLRQWWQDHIVELDKQYGPFLQEKQK